MKLAAFDLDGTLFDTTVVNYEAYLRVLKPMGYDFSFEYFRDECYGHDFSFFGPMLAPGADEEMLKQIHDKKIACYPEMLGYAKKNEHLFALLHALPKDYKTALVSVCNRQNAIDILRTFGEEDAFDLILTAEQIPKKKPDPCGYLLAMEHFGVSPEDTIIFEDSKTGIAAATASGAQVCVVTNFL